MLIQCENVTLGYAGTPVCEDVTFTLSEGDYLCVVGENGSGKSTLIRTVLGLHPALSGRVTRPDRGGIGYLPQRCDIERDFPATVREVVTSGCLGQPGRSVLTDLFARAADKKRAGEAMEKLEIADLAERRFSHLSGGQRQRVLLARALCASSRLLVMDEPVAGLDPHAAAELYATVAALHREGTAILMVTHDLSSALRQADHVLHLGRRQLFFGEREDYLISGLAHRLAGREEF